MIEGFLISKYDKARRTGAVDDWTSYDDIGKSFNGRVLTAEEYQRTEDLYISAVEFLANAIGVDRFELRNIILLIPEPSWLGKVYEGRVVDLKTALRLLRIMLRHGTMSCWLESGDALQVGVLTDFYLSVEVQENSVAFLADIERLGLYPVQVERWVDDETTLVSRTADEDFWADVAAGVRDVNSATLILERWAQGPYGHRWYLVEDGDSSTVAGSVRQQSLVTVFFGPDIRWAGRGEILSAASSAMGDDDPYVVIFSRSADDTLNAVTYGEGVALPDEDALPPGAELGLFLWPDEDAPLLRAVVPDGDRRIIARWTDPWTK